MSAWTPEKVEQLKAHMDEGMTFAQIGTAIGMGRCSCIGKAHRLGLRRGEEAKHPAKPRGPYKAQPELPPAASVAVTNRDAWRKTGAPRIEVSVAKITCVDPLAPAAPLPSALPRRTATAGSVLIHELESHHCRWPLGAVMAAPPFRYCGATALGAGPYCAEHVLRAYQRRAAA